jgi:large subunit ribosomal protein L21
MIAVEKLPGEVGQAVDFEGILYVGGGEEVKVGLPVVGEARVVGTIVEQGKAKKTLVFKFKRRKMYRRFRGHRQDVTGVRIDEIVLGASRKPKPSQAKSVQKPAPTPKEKVKEAKPSPRAKVAPKAKADEKSKPKRAPKKTAAPKTSRAKAGAPKAKSTAKKKTPKSKDRSEAKSAKSKE